MKKIVFGVALAMASLAAAQASAQSAFERDRNVSVRERPHDEYVSSGVLMGGFTAFPKVTIDGEYNDNVFATETGAEEDFVWRLAPELSVQSNWSRHSLDAYARAGVNRYSEFDGENSEDWSVGAAGQLDVFGRSYVQLNGGYSALTEPRSSSGTPGLAAEPVQFKQGSLQLGGVHELNRVRLSAAGAVREYDYDDVAKIGGGTIEQDDRDRQIFSLGGKVEYAVSPATAVFVEASANKREYRLKPPVALQNRNSDGYEVSVGADFDVSNLARGQVAVGYLAQQYDDGFEDVNGLAVRGQIEWFPTQLTTVTFSAGRSVEDSGLPGSAGYLATTASVQADLELRKNVILTGNVGWSRDDYQGASREDDRFTAGASVAWLMNRNVGVSLGYQHFDQSSSTGPSFATNRVLASLILQY